MKRVSRFLFALAALVAFWSCCEDQSVELSRSIIPKPQEMVFGEGSFKVGRKVDIVASSEQALPTANFLKELLESSSSKSVTVKTGAEQAGAINLVLDPSFENSNKEAYTLNVAKDNIVIKAGDVAGLFYGVQSLRQLMPPTVESDVALKENNSFRVPVVDIVDEPRFGWRGYMKDVSRTFYSVDVVKKYLDVMALYKMNVFHFHLTDDQGWRIEMKKYPQLTSEQTTQYPEQYNQPAERSGYYTQEQIRDIVKYAADRGITVVPEIDVPGHSWPTLLVLPELGVNDNRKPDHVFPFTAAWGHWGNQFTPNTLDPTNEAVYEFLDDVFGEVVELFPSEYIHFGGDEVMHHFWMAEPHVRDFMKRNKMTDEKQLQSYFVKRVTDIIVAKGRKPIGWNDILADASLTKQAAIMCWLGENAIVKAANNGYYSVATPTFPLYFDITQSDRNDGTMCDLNYGHINTLKAIYEYNPTEGVSSENQNYVLGVQANQWPAVPQEVKDINVQNFPRLLGLAEIAWSSADDKDFEEFSQRIEDNKARLDVLKVDYYKEGGYIVNSWSPQDIGTEYQIKEWDVTPKVYASGRATAGFYMTKGGNNLEVESVELLKDGEVISSDEHHAVAMERKNIFRPYNYSLEVKEYDPNAKYTIRASVKGQGGVDSYGNVTFSLNPYEPFTVVEP